MADLTCPDQPGGSGILGVFLSLVILPPTNGEGSITALVATRYEQSGIAQESVDQHRGGRFGWRVPAQAGTVPDALY